MQHSLEMDVVFVDGRCVINAPWLLEPVDAPTFAEAYFLAFPRCKPRSRP